MSKEKVFEFFNEAAKKESLKEKLQNIKNQDELVNLGKQEGFEFSSENVGEAIKDLQQKPGFFQMLTEAVLEIFRPSDDNYPTTGVQPFTGEPNRRR